MNEVGNPLRVLLVEDEALISDMMEGELTGRGFEVCAVSNAKDALGHLANGAPCDALFTDINLAGRVDGVTLAQMARKLRPELTVFYTSGTVAGIDPSDAVTGSTFIPKPYDPEKVCAMLQSFVAAAH